MERVVIGVKGAVDVEAAPGFDGQSVGGFQRKPEVGQRWPASPEEG